MLVGQININHCRAASDNLCFMISKGEISDIYLVQEPYRLKNGNIPGLPKGYKVFGLASTHACIITHNTSPLFFSPELSAKDFTVCFYEYEGKKKIFCFMLHR